jgi:SNARE protein 1
MGKCDEMAMNVDTTNGDDNNWRLEKYTESLEQMLNDIKTGPNQPDRETLAEYGKRVSFIKGIINTSKLPTLTERVLASEHMPSGSSTRLGPLDDTDSSTSVGQNTMVIKHRHKAKYTDELRRELLGPEDNSRGAADNLKSDKPEELDELLKLHKNMQEKIADHMLDLTRSLKEQVSLAGQIIKKDTEVLDKSGKIIDANEGTLKVESERLETFNRRACKCWMWFMLVIVCSTFIVMVMFMRLFRKRIVLPTPTPPA